MRHVCLRGGMFQQEGATDAKTPRQSVPRLDVVHEVKIGVTDYSLSLTGTMVITGRLSFDAGKLVCGRLGG